MYSYFYYQNNPSSPVDETKLSTSIIPPSDNMNWTLIVEPIGLSDPITLNWTSLPSAYSGYIRNSTDNSVLADMSQVSQYSFSAADSVEITFTVNLVKSYTLTMYVFGQGSVLPGNGTYNSGMVVSIEAISASGWTFQGWSGDASGTAKNTTVTMDSDKVVEATFAEVVPTYSLTMYVFGQGSVLPGNGTYASGTVVGIEAISASGWTFQGWSGAASGTSNTTVTMDGNKAVTATFTTNHDVAVTNVVPYKTVVGQGYSVNVSVTAANPGNYTETFNVTAYANTEVIGTLQITNLTAGGQMNLTFVWNTAGLKYGNYTLSAYAWPVPNETNTANNNCTGGWVIVSIPGDITGPKGWPDGKVDMRDIANIARAFGSQPGSSRWNPNADVDGDGKIDVIDIEIAAMNFGKHTPNLL
jgi:uncharacterized repeat protein (TIGR02543 family)